MKHSARCILGPTLFVLAALQFGCNRVAHYSGDGQLIDNGSSAATDRYVLNLGPIDLAQPGAKTFRLANLPEANFVTGIEVRVVPEERSVIEKQLVNPIVSLELSGPSGTVLFTKESPLKAWAWSVPADGLRAFVYGSGEPGTYFNALPKSEYTLTFHLLSPDRSQAKYTALLIAKSGGWK